MTKMSNGDNSKSARGVEDMTYSYRGSLTCGKSKVGMTYVGFLTTKGPLQ